MLDNEIGDKFSQSELAESQQNVEVCWVIAEEQGMVEPLLTQYLKGQKRWKEEITK